MSALLRMAQAVAARFDRYEESREDEREARALCSYVKRQNGFWPPANDKILFVFVAVLYLARLAAKEREALLRDLRLDDEFRLLVEFSKQLKSGFASLRNVDADGDAGELLQDLWQRFCESKGARADRAHIPGLDMEERPRAPQREAPPLDFGREEGCSSGGAGGDAAQKFKFADLSQGGQVEDEADEDEADEDGDDETQDLDKKLAIGKNQCAKGDRAGAVLPSIFDLVCNLVNSDYFFCLPVEKLGWNLRRAVSTCTKMRDTVEELYARLEGDPNALPKPRVMEPLEGFAPDPLPVSPFRIGEAQLLLRGIRSNNLLRSLVLQRPPNSTLPHFYTLVNATAHARLWLGRYDLRVYLDCTLTYGKLCAEGSAAAEHKALNDGFLVERGPSLVENRLRENTVDSMWGEGNDDAKLLNLRAEDYNAIPEAAAKKDKPLYEALRQLARPEVVRKKTGVDASLAGQVMSYAPLLPLETAAKRNALFKQHGMPRRFDKLSDHDTIVMLLRSFAKEPLAA